MLAVGHRPGQPRGVVAVDPDVGPRRVRQRDEAGPVEDLVDVHRARLPGERLRVVEQVADRLVHALALVQDLVGDLAPGVALREVFGEHLDRAGDAGERVLDLVRDARRQLADARQPLGADQLLGVEALDLALRGVELPDHRVEAAPEAAELVAPRLAHATTRTWPISEMW